MKSKTSNATVQKKTPAAAMSKEQDLLTVASLSSGRSSLPSKRTSSPSSREPEPVASNRSGLGSNHKKRSQLSIINEQVPAAPNSGSQKKTEQEPAAPNGAQKKRSQLSNIKEQEPVMAHPGSEVRISSPSVIREQQPPAGVTLTSNQKIHSLSSGYDHNAPHFSVGSKSDRPASTQFSLLSEVKLSTYSDTITVDDPNSVVFEDITSETSKEPSRKLSVIKEEDITSAEVISYLRIGPDEEPPMIEMTATLPDLAITSIAPTTPSAPARSSAPTTPSKPTLEEGMKCICKKCHIASRKASSFKKSIASGFEFDTLNDSVNYSGALDTESLSIDESETEYCTLNLMSMTLSKKLLDLRNNIDKTFEEFAFKWNFLSFHDKCVFNQFENEDEINLYFQQTYQFSMTPATYRYLKKCSIAVELFIKFEGENYRLLGRGDLKLSDGLRYPGKTIQVSLNVHNEMLRTCGYHAPHTVFGELTCTYNIGGDLLKIREANVATPALRVIPAKGDGGYMQALHGTLEPDLNTSQLHLDEVELKAFQTGLNLILIRNAALRTTHEEISTELEERVDWMHQELLWKLTLQENAILAGADPNLVRWRQWKDDNNARVMYRPCGNEEFKHTLTAELRISIIELHINPSSRILADESIIQIYVEYSFLNYSGILLETPCQLKPDSDNPIQYNFEKTFIIGTKDKAARLLGEMIKAKESITFTVVSEPEPNTNLCQTCIDLGSCQLNMFDLVQNSTDVLSNYYSLNDHWDNAELGKLKINVSGIFSLRSLALFILTPEDFTIIR